ncbi:GSCFA domain-containing protein [Frigidibacter sp.]|uniref:GSCFA domain-containing protein n=1 Tax=Frigidibacter sp. TaxID=2586418 RepID=UPI0027349EE9|nr:GSCFA domain-containing protein [Frigidibacter sp.]MDP3339408.1 GSCFA domain-containing protein [Frigidibacter sp.]
MSHPYSDLPPEAFWRSGVAETDPAALTALYVPKVRIGPQTRIATAGSCFAQHIGRALRGAGVAVLDAEPAPVALPDEAARAFGYGLFSGRYGNIYTVRQLVQLLRDVQSGDVSEAFVWEKDGRFYDALRPGVEPLGMDSPEEVLFLRRAHLKALGKMLAEAEVFVFTLGLTEAWIDQPTGRVFQTCPGVIAGQFDPECHVFHNFTLPELRADLELAFGLLRSFRKRMRMILTVSPVPLTATASGGHVIPATMHSKALLRVAAGEFAAAHADVDYFPSYELVTNPAARGRFFEANQRTVTAEAVQMVMAAFLGAQGLVEAVSIPAMASAEPGKDAEDDGLICEDLLLDVFRQ